jgi:hypothetical protein
MPTIGFIAAALADQEAQCAGSLVIEYTSDWCKFVDGQKTEQLVARHRYIRTSNALLMEIQQGESTVTTSYDKGLNEYRILSKQPGETSGRIGTGLGDPFGVRHMFETVRYPLHLDSLCERIAFGTVSEQTEKVDGFDCIRIEILSSRKYLEKYIVWVDAAIGYNPRKIEFVQKDMQPDVILFKDYEQVANGLWFPRKQSLQYQSRLVPAETFTVENKITGIEVGQQIPKDQILVKFPSGTRVIAGEVEFIVE